MMTEKRKAELFDAAMDWIWEHTGEYDVEQYFLACEEIGYTKKEVKEELCDAEYDEIIDEFFG